jgi:hypothetical protein
MVYTRTGYTMKLNPARTERDGLLECLVTPDDNHAHKFNRAGKVGAAWRYAFKHVEVQYSTSSFWNCTLSACTVFVLSNVPIKVPRGRLNLGLRRECLQLVCPSSSLLRSTAGGYWTTYHRCDQHGVTTWVFLKLEHTRSGWRERRADIDDDDTTSAQFTNFAQPLTPTST